MVKFPFPTSCGGSAEALVKAMGARALARYAAIAGNENSKAHKMCAPPSPPSGYFPRKRQGKEKIKQGNKYV